MKITVKAHPSAREELVEKLDMQEETPQFNVFVKEAPVRGMANRAILRLLANYFEVPINKVRIVSGLTSRYKTIEIMNSL